MESRYRKGEKQPAPRGRYKGRGIVLHAIKYGERKRIVHLLTRECGRQGYVCLPGRDARAAFQPLTLLEFDAFHGRSDLHTLEQPVVGPALREIPFDIVKSTIALFLAEVLYRLIHEGEADESLYDFVEGAILALDRSEAGSANFHLWFLVRLTHHMGYAPQQEYRPGDRLDYRNGCYCSDPPAHTLTMPPDESALFHDLFEADPLTLSQIALSRERRVSLLERLIDLYGFHTEAIHSVNSLRILGEIF